MIAHVLVVDDDPIQRRLLKNAVERFGHVAHLAENGLVALDFLQNLSGPVNVIVLDLMMPEMDGLSFLSTIRSMGIDTPVIVQTGQGGIETVVEAMRAGAFDFVVKPVSPERIGASIGNALKVGQKETKSRTGRRRAGAGTCTRGLGSRTSARRGPSPGKRRGGATRHGAAARRKPC